MKQTKWTPRLPWGWRNTPRFKIHVYILLSRFPMENFNILFLFRDFSGLTYIYILKKHIYIYLHIWFLVCGSNSGCLGDIPQQIRCGPPWFAKDAERIIWSRSSCGHCGLFCARNDAGRPGLVRSVTCLMMWGWRYWHQVFFWEDECLSMVASL